MPTSDKIYIIDGSAYFYRAYHAIPPLSNAAGLPTHAALGFTNILLRVLREKTAVYAVVAFDSRGPGFRHDIYADYKANRPPMPEDLAVQIPYIKRLVAAHNIPSLEMVGMEADDLIATAARKLAAAGCQVVVVTGDKDLLQLVNDNIIVWEPMKDVVMDADWIQAKYHVTPDVLLDLFALTGDKSDNVPGVPGIGPKTAEKLINQFGSLDELYAGLAAVPGQKLRDKLAANHDAALLSRDLIRLQEDLEIPANLEAFRLPAPNKSALQALYTELEFTRLLESVVEKKAVNPAGFSLVRDKDSLHQLAADLASAPMLVLDTETDGLDPLTADLVGLSLCVEPETAWYIPMGHCDSKGHRYDGQLDRETVLAALRPLLENPALPKVGHNLKFDYSVLAAGRCKVRLAGPLWDTMLASYLLDPARRTHKLDDLSSILLGLQLTSFKDVTNNDKRPDSFVSVPLEAARNYSCEDVYAARKLWDLFRPQLEDNNLWPLFADLEIGLVPILAEMEMTGVRVDTDLLQRMSVEFSAALAELETEIFRLAGEKFNINSPRQLGYILFDKLNLPHGRKTKTGYSTDVKVLEKLSFHELPRSVMGHRNLTKLKTTYVDKLASLVHPITGRVHSSFNQAVTATGRLSSSNPNLQNIPIRTPEGQRIRQAFVPAADYRFLAGDYSQIDLRVLAHYSQDEALLAAFRAGQDVHRQTAAEIFMVSPLLITAQMRRVAKTINFGIVYGMSSFGLAGQLNLSRREAQNFIDRYFAHYTGVKQFMEEIVEQARRDGYVTTLLHRRRSLPEINSKNRNRREFAERTAINTPIQGTAADIIKLAMIKTDRALRQRGLGAAMVLQIHDELVFEVPEEELVDTRNLVRDAMESVLELDVPLVVNMADGSDLAAV